MISGIKDTIHDPNGDPAGEAIFIAAAFFLDHSRYAVFGFKGLLLQRLQSAQLDPAGDEDKYGCGNAYK